MKAQCSMQTAFSFRDDREIRLDFDGRRITSDAGLVALREFDERIGFTAEIARCLRDRRHSSYVRHDLKQLIIQRLYGIVPGTKIRMTPSACAAEPVPTVVESSESKRRLSRARSGKIEPKH
ncbi:MAG: transposase [Armatimonadetes bacterium]|nr:transposase [Armatimonadota bacterium]